MALGASLTLSQTTYYFDIPKELEGEYNKLYHFFKDMSRAGVIELRPPDLPVNIYQSYFKEIYVLPLGPLDARPPFLDFSYPRELLETLMLVVLTEKVRVASPPRYSPMLSEPSITRP